MTIYAYCDGAVKNNGKKGRLGMGSVLLDFRSNNAGQLELMNPRSYSWGLDYDPATNNLAELLAIRNTIHVVEADPKLVYLCIRSDSEWAVKAINGVYRVSHHVELINEILELGAQFDIFQVTWVRGHSGQTWNSLANDLAQKQAGTWKGKTHK